MKNEIPLFLLDSNKIKFRDFKFRDVYNQKSEIFHSIFQDHIISWEGILGEISETKLIIKHNWEASLSKNMFLWAIVWKQKVKYTHSTVAQSNTIWNMFRPIYVLQIMYHYHKRIWQINLNYSIGLSAPLLYYSQDLTTESKGMWTGCEQDIIGWKGKNIIFASVQQKWNSFIST